MKRGLAGDVGATTEKASALIRLAIKELGNPAKFPTDPAARMRLREIAHKGWMGVTTAADAYLCATESTTARGTKRVAGVYKNVGADALAGAGAAYEMLHVGCGYRDSEFCSPASVRFALRQAGQAVAKVALRIQRMRTRGKAKRSCPPSAT